MSSDKQQKKRRKLDDKETIAQIQRENTGLPEPGAELERVQVHFTAKRETFVKRRTQHNFVTKDAGDDNRDVRSIRDPTFELSTMEVDRAASATTSLTNTSSQTPYHRRVDAAIQADPHVVDARLVPGKEETSMDPTLKHFVDTVMPRMLHHLTQSQEVPIFGDDYMMLTEEDTFVGTREDNFLREAGNFSHMHTKGKQITGIDWRHGVKNIVCVSCIQPMNFGQRCQKLQYVESSVSLVWNFADPMHPQYVLESPHEVLCIRFNPAKPHFIVGGCINGQVVVWDTSHATDTKGAKSTRARHHQVHTHEDVTSIPDMAEPVKGHSLERDGDSTVLRIQPSMISRVEMSHKRPVHDIQWLPAEFECGFDGKLFPLSPPDNNQFATVSEDGTMFIWDLRPDNLPQDKARKLKHQGKHGEDKLWVPLLKYQIAKPDGSGEVLGLRLSLEGKIGTQPSYVMCCTSIEGDLCVCNWGPKDDKASANQNVYGGGDDATRKPVGLVRQLVPAHAGPGWAVQRHPTLPDYYLTVGDWGYKVWKVGVNQPIVTSPQMSVLMTCGRWSPTRASVVFIGTENGYIHVWDLLDRSHQPVLAHQVIQKAITTIEFKPHAERRSSAQQQHLIALGTQLGTFSLFELPKVLVKGHSSESRNMKAFLEREVRRVHYFSWRWKERQREMDRMVQDKVPAGGAEGAAGAKEEEEDVENEEDNEFLVLTQDEREQFMQVVEKLEKAAEEKE